MKRKAYSTFKNKSWQSCGIAMQRTISCNSRQMWTLTIFTPNLLCMVTTYRCHTLHSTTGFLGAQYLAECLAKNKQADNKHILKGIADFWCWAAGGIVRCRELSNAQRWIQEMTCSPWWCEIYVFKKPDTNNTETWCSRKTLRKAQIIGGNILAICFWTTNFVFTLSLYKNFLICSSL